LYIHKHKHTCAHTYLRNYIRIIVFTIIVIIITGRCGDVINVDIVSTTTPYIVVIIVVVVVVTLVCGFKEVFGDGPWAVETTEGEEERRSEREIQQKRELATRS